jgi:Zn-dependent oligopeptidase
MYKKKVLDLDDNIIKEYFPSTYTIPKILSIYSQIFHIKMILVKESSHKYWNKNVQLYKVIDNQTNKKKKLLGYFFLDLYPRLHKYSHAATFDLQNTYYNQDGKRIIPITAIVCNFSPPQNMGGTGKNKRITSLLQFGEIITFCHELGHALHNILSNVKYEMLAGVSMEHDFGEMPSQFFENWAWNSTFLQKISKHYQTNERIPVQIIEKIQKNRYFQVGIQYLHQILYIRYDLELHSKKKVTKKYIHDLWFIISKELLPYQLSENTYPMCRFDHLMGYQSGYYGYLWSLIYSYDAFSLFEKKGIFNQNLGLKFRKEILEKGGTIKGTTMLENFLGRKTNNYAFLKIFK